MTLEHVFYLCAGLLVFLIAACALFWNVLQSLKKALADSAGQSGRTEQAVRQEMERLGRQAAEDARAQREEMAKSSGELNRIMLDTLGRVSSQQRDQLESFAKMQKDSLDAMSGEIKLLARENRDHQERLKETVSASLAEMRKDAQEASRATREDLTNTLNRVSERLAGEVKELNRAQNERLGQVTTELKKIGEENERRGDALRTQVEKRLDDLRADNTAKLEKMRQTVDEKLSGTLEKRLGESFGLVSRQLEQVHKSVGEMQTLANGVGDLKRVLTNVKSRGTWGEIQLENLLSQVLTPQQYETNVEVRPGSGQRVEFAIRLPGKEDHGQEVWLPIDAKFPIEDYERLLDAAERCDPVAEETASKALEVRIKNSAKDISQKYVAPPHSTDFAIMFLPTEGLYAEVLRRPGLTNLLQREFRVTVAGPTTLTALLNSLQMGFKSLAIQKRSSEVWQILGAVKTEFDKYGAVLDRVKKKLTEASNHIDKIGTRQRMIGRKLKQVESLPETDAAELLELDDPGSDLDE